MERQRSFSFKPSRLLLFSFTIFSSILFLSIFTIWLTKSTPSLHTQTLLHFNTSSSSSLQPSLTVHSLTITDAKIPTFIDNRLARSQKSYSESKSEPLIVNFTAMHHENNGTSPAKRLRDEGNIKVEASGFVGENKTQVQILRNMSIEQKIVKKECDLTKGYWVFDESYPLYVKDSCPFIDEGFDCEGNGRVDRNYPKWRWQPNDCDLPRFNATKMLELIRGKRLVFVGDSINRNQWESMLCMLLSAIKDPKRVFEARGRKITKEKGNYSFRFLVIMENLLLFSFVSCIWLVLKY